MREKEYSEWMGKQGFDVLRHANCCKIAFNGGWESRQTEVDDLQKQRDSFIKAYEIEIDENVELQKRVDSTLKVVQSMRNEVKHGHLSDDESQTLSGYANDLEQALKGEHA